MSLSGDINEKFKEYCETKSLDNNKGRLFLIPLSFHNLLDMTDHLSVDFGVLVLTAGSWPLTAQTSTFNVPQEVSVFIPTLYSFLKLFFSGGSLRC